MTLQQLRCFCATAQAGSFTAAADDLGVSQPAVAEQVRNLERLLGAALFTRAGRGVSLTGAGAAFAERAPDVLRTLSDAVDRVEDLAALRHGTVALGFNSTPTAYGIDVVASEFARRFPDVSLRLLGRNSALTADQVVAGQLEAGIVALPVDDRQLDVRPLVRDEVLYVSADPGRARRAVTIAEMATRPLVFYDADSAERDPLRRQLAERAQADGLRLSPRIEVEHIEMALRLVADGIGDTYVPRAVTRASYYPPGLHTVSFRPVVHDTFALITRRGSRMTPAVRALVEEVERHMVALVERLNREA